MDVGLNSRSIRWAGHVARMRETRRSRRMLPECSQVSADHPRLRSEGGDGYGHWLVNELNAADVCTARSEAQRRGTGQRQKRRRRVSVANRVGYSSSNRRPPRPGRIIPDVRRR